MIKDILKVLLIILAIVLFADVFGFMAWIVSGQLPVGDFYIGTITSSVLKAIIL